MEFFDTHAHLSDPLFDADRDLVLARALEAGVAQVLEIADSPADWDKAVALSRARPRQVRCSLGLHPYHADQFSLDLIKDLEQRVRLPEVAAIGEIGLDYVKTQIPRQIQLKAFEDILSAARRWEKPAVIHCRGAYPDLLGVCGGLFPSPPSGRRFWGVVHCFSGNAENALFLAERGLALGVDGPITYPKNEDLRRAFRAAGSSCLVLETDSPYLPPQSSRGKRNEPRAIPEIAEKLSETLGLSVEEIALKTTENARALYGIK
ncbi:MAG: TatD family hydrolase [Elusimicrobia bacterium]|nr:TatD family hydrolase [Elusimicrobiota bacterium]